MGVHDQVAYDSDQLARPHTHAGQPRPAGRYFCGQAHRERRIFLLRFMCVASPLPNNRLLTSRGHDARRFPSQFFFCFFFLVQFLLVAQVGRLISKNQDQRFY